MGVPHAADPIQFTRATDPPVSMPGQATVCPDLVVVPSFTRGTYTGGFHLGHIPTGEYLPAASPHALTPLLARWAAALVAHLDWSSGSRENYRAGSGHQQAWQDALQEVSRARIDVAEDDLADVVESAETSATAALERARQDAATDGAR